jgi:hypothetical protein
MPTAPEALLRQRAASTAVKDVHADRDLGASISPEHRTEFLEGSKALAQWKTAYPEIDKHGSTTPASFMQQVQTVVKQEAMRTFPTSEVWKDISWISKAANQITVDALKREVMERGGGEKGQAYCRV